MFEPTKARCLGLVKGRHLRPKNCQWQQRVPFTHKGHLRLHLTSPHNIHGKLSLLFSSQRLPAPTLPSQETREGRKLVSEDKDLQGR